jgi:hypothetical protein
LLAGAAMGLLLWLIISVVTSNLFLGALFGFIPGLIIGLGLHFTERR